MFAVRLPPGLEVLGFGATDRISQKVVRDRQHSPYRGGLSDINILRLGHFFHACFSLLVSLTQFR